MERQSPTPAGYDELTKAFFAHVVFCNVKSHGCAERALAHNVLSTGHQKVILLDTAMPTAALSEQT